MVLTAPQVGPQHPGPRVKVGQAPAGGRQSWSGPDIWEEGTPGTVMPGPGGPSGLGWGGAGGGGPRWPQPGGS